MSESGDGGLSVAAACKACQGLSDDDADAGCGRAGGRLDMPANAFSISASASCMAPTALGPKRSATALDGAPQRARRSAAGAPPKERNCAESAPSAGANTITNECHYNIITI